MVNALKKRLDQKRDAEASGIKPAEPCSTCGCIVLDAATHTCSHCHPTSAATVAVVHGIVRPWDEPPIVAAVCRIFGGRVTEIKKST